MLIRRVPLAAVALLFLACSRKEDTAADSSAMMMDSAMPGMAGMHGADTAMTAMMAHMQAVMDTASAATIKAMMSEHRRMADSMLTSMGDEMRRMNMTPGLEWTTLTDSVRQDLSAMASMSDAELPAYARAHHARMMRLMQMHRSMTRPPAR